jgi:hypothetical protein
MIAVTGPLWLHIARMLIVVLIGSSAMFLGGGGRAEAGGWRRLNIHTSRRMVRGRGMNEGQHAIARARRLVWSIVCRSDGSTHHVE